VIHDEVEDPVIDFTWFWFIGKTKLGLSFKQTGWLTLAMFSKLYQHYKNNFDTEMRLTKANMTYAEAEIKSQKEEEWF
jgi:hypothetical protein